MNTLSKYILASTLGFTAVAAPVAASANDLYGAIAYSPSSKSYGWSKDFGTQVEAENAAMNECYKRAGDCRVAVWFVNGCGAVSAGPDGWGADWGENFREAERKSTRLCSDYSYNCQIVVSQCVTGR